MRSDIVLGSAFSDYQLPDHTRTLRNPDELKGDVAKRKRPFYIYQMSSDEDFFYHHPNSVLLGFLGAVAVVLLLLMLAFWIGYKIW
jgi:hypothetical protein